MKLSVTSALVLEARACEARLLLALKISGGRDKKTLRQRQVAHGKTKLGKTETKKHTTETKKHVAETKKHGAETKKHIRTST